MKTAMGRVIESHELRGSIKDEAAKDCRLALERFLDTPTPGNQVQLIKAITLYPGEWHK